MGTLVPAKIDDILMCVSSCLCTVKYKCNGLFGSFEERKTERFSVILEHFKTKSLQDSHKIVLTHC
jgi:hypothetical protein